MDANFSTETAGPAEYTAPLSPPRSARPGAHHIDWAADRLAGRSCCCSARPAVIVLMPETPGRPHQTDLLLCWHHYRASRAGLKSAGAGILDLDGRPVTGDWPSAATGH